MYILLWIVFGGIIGWLASVITRNNNQMGIISNIVVGLLGSVIGGLVAQFTNIAPLSIFSLAGALFALMGSVIFLLVFNLFMGNRRI